MKLDRRNRLYYASLESETAIFLLGENRNLDAVTFYHHGVIYYKTDALIEALVYLMPLLFFIKAVKLVPKKWRDYLYDQVAKRRRGYFCSIEIEHKRILK